MRRRNAVAQELASQGINDGDEYGSFCETSDNPAWISWRRIKGKDIGFGGYDVKLAKQDFALDA